MALGSLPRTPDGRIDERQVIVLCGKAKMPFDYLYELFPYEFVFYLEGYVEDQREYFEYINYSLFSCIRQALNGKSKKFNNPFEKPKEEPIQRKLSEEEYDSEVDDIKKLFNIQ